MNLTSIKSILSVSASALAQWLLFFSIAGVDDEIS